MGVMIASLVWGFSEATFFFLVPDILLTAVALHSGKKAFFACAYALLGALIGGSVMYFWGANDLMGSLTFVEKVPAINISMMEEVLVSLGQNGLWAMILGPLSGIPYKIYAVNIASMDISYLLFLAASVPARLGRFALLTVVTWAIGKYVLANWSLKQKYLLLASVWIVFYTFYFLNHPNA